MLTWNEWATCYEIKKPFKSSLIAFDKSPTQCLTVGKSLECTKPVAINVNGKRVITTSTYRN